MVRKHVVAVEKLAYRTPVVLKNGDVGEIIGNSWVKTLYHYDIMLLGGELVNNVPRPRFDLLVAVSSIL